MAAPSLDSVRRLSFDDVVAMYEAGILGETDRVELEGGLLVARAAPSGSHSARVTWLTMHFAVAVHGTHEVRVQDTFRIPDGGYYLPDLMVVRPLGEDLPRCADLVVEVAVTSRVRDAHKAASYAAAGVAEYWIVDVDAGAVTVHAGLQPGGYARVRTVGRGERIVPPVPAPAVDVIALLGG